MPGVYEEYSTSESVKDRTIELFNLADDPYETKEISGTEKDKVEELLNRIEEEFEKDYTDKRPDLENFPDPLNNTDNPRSFTPI